MWVAVRPFRESDIPDKVRWINDPANHQYLHYELPLTVEGTRQWYRRVKNAADRFDGVILADGVPCGVIGLLRIDPARREAEFYVTVGEAAYRRKGAALAASRLVLRYAFGALGLARVCLFTETGNLPAQNLFEKLGFVRERLLVNDVRANGRSADRYLYGITADAFREGL